MRRHAPPRGVALSQERFGEQATGRLERTNATWFSLFSLGCLVKSFWEIPK